MRIKTNQLFEMRKDVRKYLSIEIRDEDREWLEDEYGLEYEEIQAVLGVADMYVNVGKMPEYIEVEP